MDDRVKYVFSYKYNCRTSKSIDYNGCTYALYAAKDGSGFKFYNVMIGMEYKDMEISDGATIRVYALSNIDGIPVLSCNNFMNPFYYCDKKIVLDLSKSDFSNIMMAKEMFSGVDTSKIDIILPSEDSKKLRPLSTVGMFSFSKLGNVDRVMQGIDFSSVVDASSMFYMSLGDHIDIGDGTFKSLENTAHMFSNSTVLSVSGRFGSSKIRQAKDIFNGCSQLKHIDSRLFEGSHVENMELAYNNCVELEDFGISADNIEYGANLGGIFGSAEGMDMDMAMRIASKMDKSESYCGSSMFSRWERDIYINNPEINTVGAKGFLSDVCSCLVDISAVDIHKNKYIRGILDVFDTDENNRYGWFISLNMGRRLVPHIVIVNDGIKVRDKDHEVFSVMDMTESSYDEINAKINLAKVMISDEHLLIIVRKGATWRQV